FLILFLVCCVKNVFGNNHPPRFLIHGQTEIVLRLKEGKETPAGSLIFRLQGTDPDGDKLEFGVQNTPGSDVITVKTISKTDANVYLAKELDRETRDEYLLVLTLTDGRLGEGNYITQSLLILVEDVNDNVPMFLPYAPTITIREDAKPGIITALEAKDLDEGAYGQVLYHLQELDGEDDIFAISTINGRGVVRLVGQLDYERKMLYQLRVLAVDRAKVGRINTGTAALLVRVEDVEDQPPEFISVTPVARVSEDAQIGTSVLQVRAVDGDRGVNNKIRYTIINNDEEIAGKKQFIIDRTTGVVYTDRILDREDPTSNGGAYILNIMATEVGGSINPAPRAVTEVTIIVTDINDETPTFRSPHYECEIDENAQNNTPLTFLGNVVPEVFDHDQGNNGTFQMYLRDDNGMFEVTPSRGINEASFLIRVKNSTALDYESIKVKNFTLGASEIVENDVKSSEVPVTVHIRDRNDNFPEFTKSLYEVAVPENCQAGTTVAWVQALDVDSGNFGTRGVRYTNLGGSIAHLLSLHPVSGVITVKIAGGASWDREVITRHFLTVEARDNLGSGNRNTAQLIVNIEDVNDNVPVFIQNRYETTLLENHINFESPLKVEARDLDLNGTKNSQVIYSISEGLLMANFSINKRTGIMRPNHPIDFEKLPGPNIGNVRPLHFMIQGRDMGTPSLWSEVPLIVYLQDVNDHAPQFEKNFYNRTIPEDTPSGTSVLQVKAIDNDGSAPNNEIAYRIQNGAADKFVIGATNGVISIAKGASLDPDLTEPKRTHYSLKVLAIDGGVGDSKKQTSVIVNITINDVNNKPPTFIDPGIVEIKENIPVGTQIAQLKANDLDTAAILRYSIDPATSEARNEDGTLIKNTDMDYLSLLDLNPVDGILKVAKLIDREKLEVIRLGVVVEDLGAIIKPQIATALLTIVILDENDNNPKFQKPFYRCSVTENSKNGVNICSVIANDADKNRTITYSLEGSSVLRQLIHLDSNNGDLVVANKIDHEQHPWLNLSVRAIDSGIPPRSSLTELFIQVLDENDNNPYFVSNTTNLSVHEDAPVGYEITVLEAKDADSGDYGKITYLLDHVASQGKFSLDPVTGSLRVADSLDRETVGSYVLVAEAWDNYQFGYTSGESRNVFKQIPITILDVNDNPPKLKFPKDCASVTEFHDPGSSIVMIKASDEDDNFTPNGRTEMEIIEGNDHELFILEQTDYWTAHLIAAKSLQARHGNYTLTIKARDLGSPPNTVHEKLNVCVTDFNDHAPLFKSPSQNSTLKIPENTTIGSALIQVHAEDEDIGMNGAVRYRLKADPAGHYRTFGINSETGVLELRRILNRDLQKIYDIRIEAYDLGVPTALSSDLDLTIYVSNVNEYEPQFAMDDFFVNFTENEPAGKETRKLPDTVDRDELDILDGSQLPVCYFIVGGNELGLFRVHPFDHELTVTTPLDREVQESHLLLIKASEDCVHLPANQSFFEESDDTLLKVTVFVDDINDNAPKFINRVFTGGVTTAADFGTQFMHVKAIDADYGVNAEISYYLIGRIQMTLTEGLDNLQKPPFLVEKDTGVISLNFDPQQGMKGYFDFMVLANDTGGLQDMARVFIYLLREDQRVRFVLRQHPTEIRHRIEFFRQILGNVTGAIVNVDEFKIHANQDGSVDKTRTDLYLHLVNKKDHSILEVSEVLRLVDQNIEKLDGLFKDFNVLDTQPATVQAALMPFQEAKTALWLGASTIFLGVLLLVCLALCFTQRQTYQRKLKAATATAYASTFIIGPESDLAIRSLGGRVPNTNKHSVEGSNPIWLQAYTNEWYKQADEYNSQTSERDSLDENVITSAGDTPPCAMLHNDLDRPQNVYQTLPNMYTPKKLETTEL
ncbi:cadherin-23, partial [Chrysoperla carnea]|uniref:cadherin-23 n=1 Tax=Chrysoperla carnea TaxID=189513 RepID=UPI001D05D203